MIYECILQYILILHIYYLYIILFIYCINIIYIYMFYYIYTPITSHVVIETQHAMGHIGSAVQ
jgi:multisubunit Na+/H+ antiporter MnhG subunit